MKNIRKLTRTLLQIYLFWCLFAIPEEINIQTIIILVWHFIYICIAHKIGLLNFKGGKDEKIS